MRSGLDPAELLPKPKSLFAAKSMTKDMIDIKFNTFEAKRRGNYSSRRCHCSSIILFACIFPDKISLVKSERNSIILYTERLLARTNGSPAKGGEDFPQTQTKEKPSSLLDMVSLLIFTVTSHVNSLFFYL